MNIEGSVVFVTGANRGIGRAVVDAFVQAGASRVYAATRSPQAGDNPKVVPIELDVTDSKAIQAAAEKAGDTQILINNAGILAAQPLLGATDPEAAEREMRTNYFGTLYVTRAFAPVLKRNGGGAIVNLLSILSHMNMPHVGSYCTSKAALLSLTQGIRGELARQGTFVAGILPAFVDTDMAKRVTLPKLSPQAVAESVLTAIREGKEEVYPGAASDIVAQIQRDSKAVERQFASMFRPPA
ncbi:SDR family oxidoreductase [Pendulispora albinea]|uniref:SDR family oxidoreductase n=1 Tax=Pendulispora albinea TaxID=2741071 RepID=A0ABZ2LTM1_9BACT